MTRPLSAEMLLGRLELAALLLLIRDTIDAAPIRCPQEPGNSWPVHEFPLTRYALQQQARHVHALADAAHHLIPHVWLLANIVIRLISNDTRIADGLEHIP